MPIEKKKAREAYIIVMYLKRLITPGLLSLETFWLVHASAPSLHAWEHLPLHAHTIWEGK